MSQWSVENAGKVELEAFVSSIILISQQNKNCWLEFKKKTWNEPFFLLQASRHRGPTVNMTANCYDISSSSNGLG